MLNYTAKSYSVCKLGNLVAENEDAFIHTLPNDEGILRLAISDGATESSFSKEWAQMLVLFFVFADFKNETFFSDIFPILRTKWLEKVNTNELPWYAQEKLDLGAFASFLGVSIELKTGECNITAVGDSNIFIFRNETLVLKFPIEKAIDFGSSPFLLSSVLARNINHSNFFFAQEIFDLQVGDIILLGTDAISQWLLFQIENNLNPLPLLEGFKNETISFSNWICDLRSNKEIKNDDTSLIIIKFD